MFEMQDKGADSPFVFEINVEPRRLKLKKSIILCSVSLANAYVESLKKCSNSVFQFKNVEPRRADTTRPIKLATLRSAHFEIYHDRLHLPHFFKFERRNRLCVAFIKI